MKDEKSGALKSKSVNIYKREKILEPVRLPIADLLLPVFRRKKLHKK
jgi:hypothetical protein